MRVLPLAIALFPALGLAGMKATESYTSRQATRGASVYAQSCASCHGADLQGEAGPPLIGQTLEAAYGTGTAAQLYDFISRQMPQDAPGSLSERQYLDVTAYILAQNGVPAGTAALGIESLSQVRLSEMHAGSASGATTNEIVHVAPPLRKVYGPLPRGANVNVT